MRVNHEKKINRTRIDDRNVAFYGCLRRKESECTGR